MAADSDFNDLASKTPTGKLKVASKIKSAIDAAKGQMFAPFELRAGGVYFHPAPKKDGSESEAVFFCSALRPLGLCRSTKGTDFALLFEMQNPDGHSVQLLLRLEELQQAGGELARIEFTKRGGYFGHGIRARQMFSDFVNAVVRHGRNLPRIVLADRTGWMQVAGKWIFVLPDAAITGEEAGQWKK